MKKWFMLVAVVFVATSCNPIDNYMLGKDNTPTPAVLKPVNEKVKLRENWTVSMGAGDKSAQYLKIKPVVVNDTLYSADTSGQVQAVQKTTGKVIWTKKLNTGIVSGPALARGFIALGTDSSKIVVLNQKDGSKAWEVGVSSEVLAKPLIARDKLIAKSVDGNLVALKLATGDKLWESIHGAPNLILKASSSPVLLNEKILLVGYSDGKMDAIDIENGRTLWQRSIAYSNGVSDVERLVDIDADPVVQGNTVFLGSYQGYIGALALDSGEFIWRKPASIYKNMLVKGDTLYTTDADDVVWSINKHNGRVNWKQTGLKFRGLTEPALWGDRLVLGDKTGFVHVLSTKTGDFLSRLQAGAAIHIAPTVSDNTVYIATANGKLSRYSIG